MARASTGSVAGTAARRRPSLDWPLSREEKKSCVLQLYEQDIRTANSLLDEKDEALDQASKEIATLRRLSLGSTSSGSSGRQSRASEGSSGRQSRASEGCTDASALQKHGLQQTFDDVEAAIDAIFARSDTDDSVSPHREESHAQEKCRENALGISRKDLTCRKETQITVSTGVLNKETRPQFVAEGSRRRRHSMGAVLRERSSAEQACAEAFRSKDDSASSNVWWAPVLKTVWKSAQAVSETAAEASRVIADEVWLFAREARGQGDGSIAGSKAPFTESIDWRVEFDAPREGRIGLVLDMETGDAPKVASIEEGSLLDVWNSEKYPVTVRLNPGAREALMRQHAVRQGDELIAIDGEDLSKDDEGSSLIQRLKHCDALSFRRYIAPRKEVRRAAPGGA
eukprot:TRINITY_DN6098_c0_g1_i1.p1 TRINITY_DN6098_c0_g1~~TRINITY_DN6098_c0_g1_i1.p1  ORF type:complete len:436 (-),score=76.27 TRINITY_DN6098_c0_g1_i1:13-1209(-)